MWKKILIAVPAGVAVGIIAFFSPGSIFVFFLAGLCLFAISRIGDAQERNFLFVLFFSGFLIRILIALLSLFWAISSGRLLNYAAWFNCPDYATPYLFDDSGYYTLRALYTALYWKGVPLGYDTFRYLVTSWYGYSWYNYFLGLFFYFLGYAPIASRFVNCLLGVLTAVIVYLLAKGVYGKKVARLSALLVVFFPSMLLWSVANLKETSLIFFACAMLFYTYKFSATAKPGFLVVAIVSAALQYAIRTPYPEYLYLNLAVIAIFLAYLWFARFSQRTRAFIVAAAIPLLAACAILWFHGICGIFHATAYRIFASHKLAVAEGGLCYRLLPDYFYAAGVNAQIGLMQMLRMLVLGWAHIILEPLPWRLGSPHMLMVMPQTILVYCLLPFAVLGIIFSFKKNFPYSFLLIAYFFLITPALSISGGNIGTTFRLRDMVMPVFLIFSALGLVEAFGGRKLNHDDA